MDELKPLAIESIKASTAMYFSCDVAKFLNRENGTLNIENSWGNGANNRHLIATDKWMDEYLFRVVINKKYVPKKYLDMLKQKPIMLPAWDPLFVDEQ
ncbi:MAG: hypothetical protein K2H44_03935 [Muribaculaceae bacterium]|nr:hypothetical protein [Muribaculaceae bacterium]